MATFKVKAIFSSSNSKMVEAEYGSGVHATWATREEAQAFADQQMKCFAITYKVVEAAR